MTLAAVEKRLIVRLAPAEAFDLFTRQLARWWPLASHSCAADAAADVLFEPIVGGLVTEVARGGARHVWGTLTKWDPPHEFAMTWHPGRPASEATRLTVRFSAAPSGATEVWLLHDGWEARDAAARDNYDGGWERVLARFVAVAKGEG